MRFRVLSCRAAKHTPGIVFSDLSLKLDPASFTVTLKVLTNAMLD